ncbi:MAG: hypothetical protein PVJ60_00500 [Phycisphaerales bacterium]|jgi:hypothetical protein
MTIELFTLTFSSTAQTGYDMDNCNPFIQKLIIEGNHGTFS